MSPISTIKHDRIKWVDIAKGISIILVVMMHSTLGVEAKLGTNGFMHYIVEFAKPFRIPAFFVFAGLFAARSMQLDWRLFFDKKILHFAYFYCLWLIIQAVIKSPTYAETWSSIPEHILYGLIQPFSTLWFIYLLPIFFVVTRFFVEKNIPLAIILFVSAGLEMAPIGSSSVIVNEFANRYVFFVIGYAFPQMFFSVSKWTLSHEKISLIGIGIYAIVTAFLVSQTISGSVFATLPFVSFFLGLFGAFAIAACASLLTRKKKIADSMTYIGSHSLVVYLAFFFFMAITRILLLKMLPNLGVGLSALIVTISAVLGPLILDWLINRFNFGHFLFVRPVIFRIDKKNRKLFHQVDE